MKKASEKATAKSTINEDVIKQFIGGADKSKTDVAAEVSRLESQAIKVEERKFQEAQKRQNKDAETRYFKAISMRFTKDEIDLLDQLKNKKGVTRLAIIRIAIAELVERELNN
ncbi:MAG: hypothetical protein methR_PLP0017 (plasmid) [Methyloprofundus sp.]|nr:MAG: hypothetical protein methR_PLP0017 [Methyloprofundus sp.]